MTIFGRANAELGRHLRPDPDSVGLHEEDEVGAAVHGPVAAHGVSGIRGDQDVRRNGISGVGRGQYAAAKSEEGIRRRERVIGDKQLLHGGRSIIRSLRCCHVIILTTCGCDSF